MRVHSPSTHPAWVPPKFWFTLEGVSSAGNCPLWEGNLLFYMDTKEAYSLLMGAYMANKEIAVAYDDTKLVNYHCVAMYITIGDPPPLY